jgi:hypothetical protein
MSRRTLKGVIGLALVDLGIILIVNSALDVLESSGA